ncbi:MAG: DUF3592 domain-containing protein [Spirochaetaceae bacterium]
MNIAHHTSPGPEPSRYIDVAYVIKRDYLSSLLIISPAALWIAVFVRYVAAGGALIYLIGAAVGTVLLVGTGFLRIGTIMSLADTGTEVTASVQAVFMRGNKGRIEFTYVYDGERYEASAAFRTRDLLRDLPQGTQVPVLVDPAKPQRAILPDLYRSNSSILARRRP